MRNLLALFLPILLMMACASPTSENEEWFDVDLIALRSGINISAEMTEYQLLGEENDFAKIEFTINAGEEELPESINFRLKINSSFDFEGQFSVNEENGDFSVSTIENLEDNIFNVEIKYGDPTDIGIEDVACLAPPPEGCGVCPECITFEIYN